MEEQGDDASGTGIRYIDTHASLSVRTGNGDDSESLQHHYAQAPQTEPGPATGSGIHLRATGSDNNLKLNTDTAAGNHDSDASKHRHVTESSDAAHDSHPEAINAIILKLKADCHDMAYEVDMPKRVLHSDNIHVRLDDVMRRAALKDEAHAAQVKELNARLTDALEAQARPGAAAAPLSLLTPSEATTTGPAVLGHPSPTRLSER